MVIYIYIYIYIYICQSKTHIVLPILSISDFFKATTISEIFEVEMFRTLIFKIGQIISQSNANIVYHLPEHKNTSFDGNSNIFLSITVCEVIVNELSKYTRFESLISSSKHGQDHHVLQFSDLAQTVFVWTTNEVRARSENARRIKKK